MSELNPVQLSWARVKWYLQENNRVGDLTLNLLEGLKNEALSAVGADDWAG
jgi:hypothetical protein